MKIKLLLLFTLTALVFTSCSKDDETDTQWEEANEAAFNKISTTSGYKKIESQSKNGSIAYRVIKSGNGKTPIYTDKVKVFYEGWYKRYDWNKDDIYTNENGIKIKNKFIFDSTSNRADVPAEFKVSGVVDGFTTALQHMKVGDKWEVWIPWRLGYGPNGNSQGGIPGFTTLVFEIELLEIL